MPLQLGAVCVFLPLQIMQLETTDLSTTVVTVPKNKFIPEYEALKQV